MYITFEIKYFYQLQKKLRYKRNIKNIYKTI